MPCYIIPNTSFSVETEEDIVLYKSFNFKFFIFGPQNQRCADGNGNEAISVKLSVAQSKR